MKTVRLLPLVLAVLACERRTSPPPQQPPEPVSAVASCQGAERLTKRWAPARERELADVLAAVPGEWPRRILDTIDRRLREAGPAWAASYRVACAEHDLARQRCLDRRADDLDALLGLLVEVPDLAVDLASSAEIQLVGLEVCEHPSGPTPGPLSPELGSTLAQTSLMFALGEYALAAPRVDSLAQAPSIVDDPIHLFTVSTMTAVLELAAGNLQGAGDRTAQLGPQLDQVGPRERSIYLHIAAVVALQTGDRAGAIAAIRHAITAERELGDPLRVALALENLAKLQLDASGDVPGASASLTEAIGIYTRLLGSESAHAAAAQLELASLLAADGRVDAAYDLSLQARDGFSVALGSDHPSTYRTVLQLGRLLLAAERPSDAYHAFLDLIEIAESQFGERDVRVADAKLELAEALRAMAEHEGARLTFIEALPVLVEGHGADHRSVVQTSVHLGQTLVELGRIAGDHELLDEAESHCKRGRSLALALPTTDALRADADRCITDLAAARKRAGKRKPR